MLGESMIWWALAALLVVLVVAPYWIAFERRSRSARERRAEAVELGIDRPTAQYPFIDALQCIGCGACVDACPEGDPLGVVAGTAVVINGLRCVGHGECATACPVGAIEIGLGDLEGRKDIPRLSPNQETSVPGIYIAGELGGLALVRNACRQGRDAVRSIAAARVAGPRSSEVLDLVIVGAGPSGLSAALEAESLGLRYRLLEREANLGGTLLHYPRRKMVLTQTVDLGEWGSLDGVEYSKEDLLDFFQGMIDRAEVAVEFSSPVDRIERQGANFEIASGERSWRSEAVLLCLGRRGTPRKLGVPGEERSKVMYRLIDAASYQGERILIVGGGDSAVEAALGLAEAGGNTVTLSYRKPKLFRIKKKNQDRIDRAIADGSVRAVFDSNVESIGETTVTLATQEGSETIDNDFVFVFAGGIPPFGFLKEIGVRFGGESMTDRSIAPTPASNSSSAGEGAS